MKKIICLLLVVMITGSILAACNFNTNFSDSTGLSQMDAKPKVEEMLAALAAADTETAKSLMHPNAEIADGAFDQQIQFLNGRKVETLEQISLTVNNTTGASGTSRRENGAFRLVLDDGAQIHLAVHYLSTPGAEGFESFQIVLSVP